ncbi:MAG TPA: hypothetical protein VIL95_07460, partial [Bacillota bacterium]
DLDAAIAYAYDQGWTDGLPVIPPTDRLVARFLDAAGLDGDEVLGTIPPRGVAFTAEKVAANAVMAGCLPEYMPVVVAAIRAMTDPRFNLHATCSSTGGAAHLIVVNGPIAKELGINAGPNVFGQGFRANATIGRAVQLCLRNIGQALPGLLDRSTLGNPGKYTLCIAELEEFSPWEPLSVTRGFQPGQNVVTVFATESPQYIFNYLSDDPVGILTAIGYKMAGFGNYHHPHGPAENPVVLCPEHVRSIHRHGWGKEQVRDFLYQAARRSAADLKRAGKMEGPIQPGDEERMIPLVDDPALISIVVAGGHAGGVSAHVPGWAGGRQSRSVSCPITT